MKRYIFVILAVLFVAICLCSFIFSKSTSDTIQLWAYMDDLDDDGKNEEFTKLNIEKIKNYCKDNSIELELNLYGESVDKPIDYDQYLLKRNVAIAKGNALVLSTYSNNDLYQLRDICMDYTRLKNYNNLYEKARGRYYIPLFFQPYYRTTSADMLDSYNINKDKKFYSFQDFLDLFDEINMSGADFKLNTTYFYYMVESCKKSNNILFLDDSQILNDNYTEIVNNVVKTINDISDNLLRYSESAPYEYSNFTEELGALQYVGGSYLEEELLFDQNTNTSISDYISGIYNDEISKAVTKLKLANNSMITYCNGFYPGVLLFVHEKVTNDKLYDIVDKLLEDYDITQYVNDKGKIIAERAALQALYFIRLHTFPMHDVYLFRVISGLDENYNDKYKYVSNYPLEIMYEAIKSMYGDDKESREILAVTNSQNYINTRIDQYIREYIYKCMSSETLELVATEKYQDELHKDIEELISKAKIYLN